MPPFSLPSALPGPATVAATATDGTLVVIPDFCGDADDLIIGQYKDSPLLQALICSFVY